MELTVVGKLFELLTRDHDSFQFESHVPIISYNSRVFILSQPIVTVKKIYVYSFVYFMLLESLLEEKKLLIITSDNQDIFCYAYCEESCYKL